MSLLNLTLAEAAFVERAHGEGWHVLRHGWPDFLCHRGGKLRAVEVKGDGSRLNRDQLAVLRILHAAGVSCSVWTQKLGYVGFEEYENSLPIISARNRKVNWCRCHHCDKAFPYRRSTRRFCSDRCRKAAARAA